MNAVRTKRPLIASMAGIALLATLAACAGEATTTDQSAAPKTPAHSPAAPSPAATAIPGTTTQGSLPPVISRGPVNGNRIALTFDSNMTDAMLDKLANSPKHSYANDRVVDELQKAKAPATFFLASKWVQQYPALTRRIAADPNFELASHSYAHHGFTSTCYDLGSMPASEMATDVNKSFDVLKPYGGHQTRYFRFPGGCYDKAALAAIAPAGCTVIQYSIVGADPFNDNVSSIVDNVLSGAKAGGIVVMHITKANAPKTDQALPAIISGLRKKGYQLVTLSALLTENK